MEKINRDTLIPISMVITLISGVLWLSGKFNDIELQLDKMERKLEDQWSATEMENWSLKLKMRNPDIEIPEVE